jgi:hypothetical protein
MNWVKCLGRLVKTTRAIFKPAGPDTSLTRACCCVSRVTGRRALEGRANVKAVTSPINSEKRRRIRRSADLLKPAIGSNLFRP